MLPPVVRQKCVWGRGASCGCQHVTWCNMLRSSNRSAGSIPSCIFWSDLFQHISVVLLVLGLMCLALGLRGWDKQSELTLLMWTVQVSTYRMNIIWGCVWNKGQVQARWCGSSWCVQARQMWITFFFHFPYGKSCMTCVVMASDMVGLHLRSDAEEARGWPGLTDKKYCPCFYFLIIFWGLFPPCSMCDCVCYPAMLLIAFGVPQNFENLVKLVVLEMVSESLLPNRNRSFC